ncbi:MAG: hypothetical protein ACREKN_06920 [Longimicrobiaceae bacterium]
MSVVAELRADRATCRRCAAPLAGAALVRRSWRTIRAGEWIGGRGEYVTVRCECGETRRLLHSVQMAPYRGGAA